MEVLYPLFFANLADNIPSVRQGAAVALCNVAKAYGELCSAEKKNKCWISIGKLIVSFELNIQNISLKSVPFSHTP